MGSIRFVFLGVLVSLILAVVLIPSSARAEAQERLSRPCSFCHAGPSAKNIEQAGSQSLGAEEEKIAQKIKSYSDTPRYQIHAGLEILALSLDLIAALYMFFVAFFGFFQSLIDPETRPLARFLLGLNLLIVGEIIGSISTTINPTWIRIAVLLSVVIIRVLISLILQMEQRIVRENLE